LAAMGNSLIWLWFGCCAIAIQLIKVSCATLAKNHTRWLGWWSEWTEGKVKTISCKLFLNKSWCSFLVYKWELYMENLKHQYLIWPRLTEILAVTNNGTGLVEVINPHIAFILFPCPAVHQSPEVFARLQQRSIFTKRCAFLYCFKVEDSLLLASLSFASFSETCY
jgi:hypothetical protein